MKFNRLQQSDRGIPERWMRAQLSADDNPPISPNPLLRQPLEHPADSSDWWLNFRCDLWLLVYRVMGRRR